MPQHSIIQALFNRRMLVCIFTGFSSGLPLYILINLIPAWLRKEGIDLSTIGLFTLATFPYTWKFIWSPLVDKYIPPFLGRRRGWAIIIQILLLIAISSFALCNPQESVANIAVLVFIVAFFSATQDIVLDAYRREILPDHELGVGNSFFVNAYRISALVPGSLALIAAAHLPWETVHIMVASFMLIGILTTLIMSEANTDVTPPATLKSAIVDPFKEFFGRRGIKQAIYILLFMLLYKLGDNMATALATPFYIDLGFSLDEIGAIAKLAALWASIAGGIIGGIMMIKMGINRALWLFGAVQMGSILGYVWLSEVGAIKSVLFIVVSMEYIGVGLGTVALMAFIAQQSNKHFTATQIALFTSLIAIPRTFVNASTGFIIEAIGYTPFFLLCTAMAIPGMLMLIKVAPWHLKSPVPVKKMAVAESKIDESTLP